MLQPHALHARLFRACYASPSRPPALRRLALEGRLARLHLRSVAWRVWLGVLPLPASPAWGARLRAARERYAALAAAYARDEAAAAADPLAATMTAHEHAALTEQVDKDLARLGDVVAPDALPAVAAALRTLLRVYAHAHPEHGYQQGFHEVAAVLLDAVLQDARLADGPAPEEPWEDAVAAALAAPGCAEADAYALFEALMARLGGFYNEAGASTPEAAAQRRASTSSAAHFRCERLLQQLARLDPAYFRALIAHGVVSSAFGVRWVRLLFLREVGPAAAQTLWDAAFAYGHQLKLVGALFHALLLYLRHDVLAQNNPLATLALLMHVPPVEDPAALVRLATALADGRVALRAGVLCTPDGPVEWVYRAKRPGHDGDAALRVLEADVFALTRQPALDLDALLRCIERAHEERRTQQLE